MKIPACSLFLSLQAPRLIPRTAAELQRQHAHSSWVLGRKTLLTWNPTNMLCQRLGGTWHGGSAQVCHGVQLLGQHGIGLAKKILLHHCVAPRLHPHVEETHTDERESYGLSMQEHHTRAFQHTSSMGKGRGSSSLPGGRQAAVQPGSCRSHGAGVPKQVPATNLKAPRGEWEHTLRWRAGQRSNCYSSMTGKVTKIEVLEGSKTICEVGPNLTNSFSQNGENN